MSLLLIRIGATVIIASAVAIAVHFRRHFRRNSPHPYEPSDPGPSKECLICRQETFEKPLKLPCKHTFHSACIELLKEVEVCFSCPVCRKTFAEAQ